MLANLPRSCQIPSNVDKNSSDQHAQERPRYIFDVRQKYTGKRPQTVWGSGRIMYDDDDDDGDD